MALLTSKKNIFGLNTSTNLLTVPPGKTVVADNLVVDRFGTLSPRRGFKVKTNILWYAINEARALREYNGDLIVGLKDGEMPGYGGTGGNGEPFPISPETGRQPSAGDYYFGFATVDGKVGKIDAYFTGSCNFNDSWYFASVEPGDTWSPDTKGVLKNTFGYGRSIKAGAYVALDISAEVKPAAGSKWFFPGGGMSPYVAYRYCWVREYKDGTIVRGAPSHPIVVYNNLGVDSYVTLTCTCQSHEMAEHEGHFSSIELYRTPLSNSIDTGDDYFLVSKTPITSSSEGRFVLVDDVTPDSFLGAPLYTNPTSEGALAANYPPPYSKVMNKYNDVMFYGDTEREYSMTIKINSVDTTWDGGALRLEEDIWDGYNRNYKVSLTDENPTTRTFKAFTSGSPSENIENTARSLVRVINRSNPSGWYAEYLSGPYDIPGQIRIWGRRYSQPFTLSYDEGDPILDIDITSNSAVGDKTPHRLYFSKPGQPDHVPLLNFINVGAAGKRIIAITPMPNFLLVAKEDGLYSVSGIYPLYDVRLIDATQRCIAPRSIVTIKDSTYMLTNQGFIRITVNGDVEKISAPIRDEIDAILRHEYVGDSFASTFGEEGSYICWTPSKESSFTNFHHALVFNPNFEEWTRWFFPATCATNLNNDLWVYSLTDKELCVLRNTGTSDDYQDTELDVEISTITSNTLELRVSISKAGHTLIWHTPASYFEPKPGGVISVSDDEVKFTIESVEKLEPITEGIWIVPEYPYSLAPGLSDRYLITTKEIITTEYSTFTPGVYHRPIPTEILLPPDACNEAGVMKIFQDITVMLEQDSISNAELIYAINEDGNLISIPIHRAKMGGWGAQWGTPWGAGNNRYRSVPIRQNVSIAHNTGEAIWIGFKHSGVFEHYRLLYVGVTFENGSEITSID